MKGKSVLKRNYNYQLYLIIMLTLLNIGVTLFFASIENPVQNTFSMIGSRYDILNLTHFIFWAVLISFTTFLMLIIIFFSVNYNNTNAKNVLVICSFLLPIITFVPAKLEMPVLRWIHILLGGVYAFLMIYVIHPFIGNIFVTKMARYIISIWMILIWLGSIIIYYVVGHNSIYQIYYFINIPIFLLVIYLYIIKYSDKLESNLSLKQYIKGSQDIIIISIMLFNILITILYGTLKDPYTYTLSMIGNLFNTVLYLGFIIWGLIYSLSVYYVFRTICKKIKWNNRICIRNIQLSTMVLILITIIPARAELPVLHNTHIILTVTYLILFSIGFSPIIMNIFIEKLYIKTILILWMIVIWVITILLFVISGNNGLFEMWYLTNIPLILIVIYVLVHRGNLKKISKTNQ